MGVALLLLVGERVRLDAAVTSVVRVTPRPSFRSWRCEITDNRISIFAKGDYLMAAMKPRTGDGPMEAVKEGRLIIVRVPLEGGGRLVVSVNDDEAKELHDALAGVVASPPPEQPRTPHDAPATRGASGACPRLLPVARCRVRARRRLTSA